MFIGDSDFGGQVAWNLEIDVILNPHFKFVSNSNYKTNTMKNGQEPPEIRFYHDQCHDFHELDSFCHLACISNCSNLAHFS